MQRKRIIRIMDNLKAEMRDLERELKLEDYKTREKRSVGDGYDRILKLVSANDGIPQQDLVDTLSSDINWTFGINKTREIIEYMVTDKLLRVVTGAHNAKSYYAIKKSYVKGKINEIIPKVLTEEEAVAKAREFQSEERPMKKPTFGDDFDKLIHSKED